MTLIELWYMGYLKNLGVCNLLQAAFQVMDGGEVVDFDDPYTLLQDENSQLKIMVDKTGPSSSKQLHQVAEAAYHSRKQRRDTFN